VGLDRVKDLIYCPVPHGPRAGGSAPQPKRASYTESHPFLVDPLTQSGPRSRTFGA